MKGRVLEDRGESCAVLLDNKKAVVAKKTNLELIDVVKKYFFFSLLSFCFSLNFFQNRCNISEFNY
jgi:hypothetical protein